MKKIFTLKSVLIAVLMAVSIGSVWADENDETVKPVAAVDVADIAAFNALEDGTVAKLALNNARVNAYNDLSSTYYVEDASGATAVKGIGLTKGTALNGYIIGVKGTEDVDYVNEPSQGLEYSLTVEDAALSAFESTPVELVGTSMTIAEACQQTTYGKLVTLSDVTIEALGNGRNKQLTDAAGNTIKTRDLFDVLGDDYEWPAKASKMTGIVLYYMTGWFIIPISQDAIVATGTQPTDVVFDFSSPNFRDVIGEKVADPKGNIYNETFVVDNVSLQVTAGSAASKIYVDANRGQNLVTYKEYATLTFRAPEGYAISSITFTAAGNSNINSVTASSGIIEGMTWTGNAEGVRFSQGGTSNLANAIVKLAAKDDATTALPAIEYTECANIAAFNALENGTYAKVQLSNAEVTGISADGFSTMWLQDATGGCWIQYSSLIDKYLEVNNQVNGYFYVVKRTASGNPQMKEAEDTPESQFTQTPIGEPTMVEGTLAEVNVAANLNKVVKIKGASFVATSATAGTLTQGDATIDVSNGTATANQQLHKIDATWVKDETTMQNVTIVAILVAKSATANQLLPISMTEEQGTGISNVQTADQQHLEIYNLQGMRLNQLQKGLNIVNGKKMVVK